MFCKSLNANQCPYEQVGNQHHFNTEVAHSRQKEGIIYCPRVPLSERLTIFINI